ncbi:hypothetical protein [Aeromonas veronii]|uniref:hypothetical protein n=1 Tax=Aeromonas veronii TaxID=654 RepID=UPI002446619B|nr:hypothetical protein [Aeromonas veronii]
MEGVTGLHVFCVMQLWDEQSVPPVNISDETSRALSGISRNLNQALIIAHGRGVLNVADLAAMSADIAAIKKTIMG